MAALLLAGWIGLIPAGAATGDPVVVDRHRALRSAASTR
jgi:hypothetical protein